MRKVTKRKYERPTKELLDVIELFQPIGTVDIIQLSGMSSDHAFCVGILRALEETGKIVRDDDTGMYWIDSLSSDDTGNHMRRTR